MDRERWHRLSPLLDRAFDLEPEDLARWLRRLGAEEPALAKELEELLDVREAMCGEGFLDEGTVPFSFRFPILKGKGDKS